MKWILQFPSPFLFKDCRQVALDSIQSQKRNLKINKNKSRNDHCLETDKIVLWNSIIFQGFLWDSIPTSLVFFRRFLFYGSLSIDFRRFYTSVMHIINQSPYNNRTFMQFHRRHQQSGLYRFLSPQQKDTISANVVFEKFFHYDICFVERYRIPKRMATSFLKVSGK